jgi:RNA polymerase sigma-70 factor (ECF subfamily)
MHNHEQLALVFEAQRPRLRGVAFRLLGSLSEADDAVQEAWLRLNRADPAQIENLGGWLSTVVARVCLDALRTRRARREEPLLVEEREALLIGGAESDPEQEALLADAVGLALLVVLDALQPAERLAFVLHDIFGVPFGEIAPLVERSSEATRQLASRARRRVRGAARVPSAELAHQRAVVEAFLRAAREGDFAGLLELLDPEVVLRADAAAVALGGPAVAHGAAAVARVFAGRAEAARPALVEGVLGVVVAPGGRLQLAIRLTLSEGRIAMFEVVADPAWLARLTVAVLDT